MSSQFTNHLEIISRQLFLNTSAAKVNTDAGGAAMQSRSYAERPMESERRLR